MPSIAARAESSSPPFQVRQRTILTLLASFWCAFFILVAGRAAMVDDSQWLISLPRRAIVAVLGALLSTALLSAIRRLGHMSIATKAIGGIGLSLIFGSILAIVNPLIFYLSSRWNGETCFNGSPCSRADLILNAKEYWVNYAFVFLACVVIYLWIESNGRSLLADRAAGKAREDARIAEIRALRYQLNPHFLFNCLNSLATLVYREDRSDAQSMIDELGAFLRYGLASDPIADVELADEIDMQLRYLTLERRRFVHRVIVKVAVAEDVRRTRVPSLILQPLIENAVKHGVANTSAPVTISIHAYRTTADMVEVVIDDDAWNELGPGVDGPAGFGIGLRNVAERLFARFGDAASLNAASADLSGFRATLIFPLVTR